MSDLFLKIVNMSISASWIVLAIIILRVFFKKAPKWTRVLLWGIVAVRLMCPFSIESAFSLIPSAETINPEIMVNPTPVVQTEVNSTNHATDTIINQTTAYAIGESTNTEPLWNDIISYVWIAGIVILIGYTFVSYIGLRRKINTAVCLKSNVYQSENVNTPFVLGIVKPKIYIPFNMDTQEIIHVIAHEKAHIRRKDHLWKPLGFILLSINWFNPLMWLAYILLCRDIELACDEKVIKELDNSQRADYSQTLLGCSVNHRMIAACPIAFGEVGVKKRVKTVLNYKKPAFWTVVVAIVICIIVAVCFLTNPPKQEKANNANGTVSTTSDNGSDTAIVKDVDLNHDGEAEKIYVDEKVEDELYELKVVKQDGTVLWTAEAGIPHVGWNTIMLYENDGKDYLVEYNPYMMQGMGNYSLVQFSLEGGKKNVTNTWTVEFKTPGEISDEMKQFEENVNLLLENSTVLLSTEQMELVIGPKEATELQQLYPVRFE